MLLWLEHLICLHVIGYANYFLSSNGDITLENTGIPASWVGFILLLLIFILNTWILFQHG